MSKGSGTLISISLILLLFVALGATRNLSSAEVSMRFVWYIVSVIVMSIPPIIAYKKNLIKRETIYILSFVWIIPFSWIIAFCMALFGKSETDIDTTTNNHSLIKTHRTTVKRQTTIRPSKKNINLPTNAIDKTFYKIGHGAASAVRTISESRVVSVAAKTTLKIILIIAVIFLLGLVKMLATPQQQVNQKYSNRYQPVSTYKSSNHSYTTQKKALYNQKPTPQKSAEQIWFEHAADSMR